MEKYFVPYGIAKELKEIGFDEPCFKYYDQSKDICSALQLVKWNSESKVLTAAPLYDQVIDWFMVKHNLNITTDDFLTTDDTVDWDYSVHYIGTNVDEAGRWTPVIDYDVERSHPTRHDALNVGILKTVELIKQKEAL